MTELERITIAKNRAANGRTFCVLLFAASIAAYLVKQDSTYMGCAILSTWPLAAAYLVEPTNSKIQVRVASIVSGILLMLVVIRLSLI